MQLSRESATIEQVNREVRATASTLTRQLQTSSALLRAMQRVLQDVEHVRLQPQYQSHSAEQQLDVPGHLARLLSERYAADHTLFPFWESYGFHVTPVHFYSPLPQVSSLSEALWTQPSELVGIDLNVPGTIAVSRPRLPAFSSRVQRLST